MEKVRFMKHYVINESGNKCRVHYSVDNHISMKPCVTVYAKGYLDDLFAVFSDGVQNGTDTSSDHFEKDRIRFFEDSPFYSAARDRATA